jgi:UDP-N-acetylmuramyl pentapeptide phosphotransferase/UDP-N-acetylglucosamine-1-phosphate transferase
MTTIPILLASFVVAVGITWLLLRFEGLHAHLSHDCAASGPQKFHVRPTPRIGGAPIACGLAAGLGLAVWRETVDLHFALAFALSVLPAYASGLIEDVTKKLGPDIRLWASFLSALVAVYFFDAVVARSGIPGIDDILLWFPLALVFTVIAVGGVAHALNIVDGYNGLAGGTTMLMLLALGYVSWRVGDTELGVVCLALLGGTLGFFFWNFPSGRIFAGDGGAYLWGVSIALISVLLIHRHPEVSPWFPLAVLIYPVFETLFTVYRRKVKQATEAGLPDAKHLHQLVYRRLIRPRIDGKGLDPTRRNAATSPFLWALASLSILPAALFWRDTSALVALVIAFGVAYVWLYRSIVRFHVTPDLGRLGRIAAHWARARDTG